MENNWAFVDEIYSLHIWNHAGFEPTLEEYLHGSRQSTPANSCENSSKSNEMSL